MKILRGGGGGGGVFTITPVYHKICILKILGIFLRIICPS